MNNTCDILIKNGNVIIPFNGIVKTNILIENGKIKALKKTIGNVSTDRVINAEDKYILPGIIDPHVHYGVFTPIESAAKTESMSAVTGGITTIMRMIRLDGSYRKIVNHLEVSRRTHITDYAIHASILDPSQIKEMSFLKSIGINSFKIYMNLGSELKKILADLDPGDTSLKEIEVDMSDGLLTEIIKMGSALNSIILVHAEDHVECSRKMIEMRKRNEQVSSDLLKLWSSLRPESSEVNSIKKVLNIALDYEQNLYFVHIGSSQALNEIYRNKKLHQNLKIWIETCPHYLTHTTDYDNIKGKVVPPLRSKGDLVELWNAIKSGIIDTIGTDHVANDLEIKKARGNFWNVPSGFSGLGTMLPVMLSEGVNKKSIDLVRISEICSANASRIFGFFPQKGTIMEGSDADLTIVDMEKEQRVSSDLLNSHSDYTIYEGWKLKGWPVMTIVRGKVVMEDGKVDQKNIGHGKFIETTKTRKDFKN
ncbi:MAG: dihydroorotase [Thaumarchaeota archaeon]|nr:MAG: dihydroorotase [Nitrososphaerota archaeon]